jgi:hypothetical protein
MGMNMKHNIVYGMNMNMNINMEHGCERAILACVHYI